jgi:hypothetical protein
VLLNIERMKLTVEVLTRPVHERHIVLRLARLVPLHPSEFVRVEITHPSPFVPVYCHTSCDQKLHKGDRQRCPCPALHRRENRAPFFLFFLVLGLLLIKLFDLHGTELSTHSFRSYVDPNTLQCKRSGCLRPHPQSMTDKHVPSKPDQISTITFER